MTQWLATKVTYGDPIWTRADVIMVISYAVILVSMLSVVWNRR